MTMNKSQINFFCERANITKKRVKDTHDHAFLPQQQYSVGQMAAMIASGQARFRSDLFEDDRCPRLSANPQEALGMLFDFPGESEIQAQNARRHEIVRQVCKRIDNYVERMKEDFVMKEIPDPRQALRDLENTDFFKESEREILNNIAINNEG